MSYISEQLETHTAANSKYELSRPYLSISHSYESVEGMVKTYREGFSDSLDIRLKCYRGYRIEQSMVGRIIDVFGLRVMTGHEIREFNGLVQGHPDFCFDGYPGDVKSVPLDEHLPQGKIPNKVYWQMQGYMWYMKKDRGLLVYESSASGHIRDYWVNGNPRIQQEIDRKFCEAVKIIKG